MKKSLWLLALFALTFAAPARASLWDAVALGVGAQETWFDSTAASFDQDFEATGNAALSMTPHFSLVGGAAWGAQNHYLRATAGVRATATDVNDKTFSIGLGIERQWVTEASAGIDEWVADANVGLRPFKAWSATLAGQGGYGLTSQGLRASLGVRIPFKVVTGGGQP